jgi:HAD domain in Swiss Army Knife RNA repair proteins
MVLKVLFLDIDGVLLPFPNIEDHNALFPRSTVQALQYLLQETGAELVLSSTWRVRQDFVHDIIECLQHYGVQIEQFYGITDPTMHSERQWEIAKWLSDHHHHSPVDKIVWLALDDENLLDGDANQKYRNLFEGHVIQTKSDKGLTMDDVKKGLELWKKQI